MKFLEVHARLTKTMIFFFFPLQKNENHEIPKIQFHNENHKKLIIQLMNNENHERQNYENHETLNIS